MVADFDFSDLYIEGRNGHLFLLRQDTGAVFGFSIFTLGFCEKDISCLIYLRKVKAVPRVLDINFSLW